LIAARVSGVIHEQDAGAASKKALRRLTPARPCRKISPSPKSQAKSSGACVSEEVLLIPRFNKIS
jgi:hypothetical protein